jgi:hypothetical protein
MAKERGMADYEVFMKVSTETPEEYLARQRHNERAERLRSEMQRLAAPYATEMMLLLERLDEHVGEVGPEAMKAFAEWYAIRDRIRSALPGG